MSTPELPLYATLEENPPPFYNVVETNKQYGIFLEISKAKVFVDRKGKRIAVKVPHTASIELDDYDDVDFNKVHARMFDSKVLIVLPKKKSTPINKLYQFLVQRGKIAMLLDSC